MSLDFPVPVRDAVAVAYTIDASVGSAVDSLVTTLWGDAGRVGHVADEWEKGAGDATESINMLRTELRRVADERSWEGPAKDSYQLWIDRFVEQTLAPARSGLEDVGRTLHDTAETIEVMRAQVVRLCASFVGAVAALFGGPAGSAAALVLGTWFVGALMDLQVDCVDALDDRAAEMRAVRDRTVGGENTAPENGTGQPVP